MRDFLGMVGVVRMFTVVYHPQGRRRSTWEVESQQSRTEGAIAERVQKQHVVGAKLKRAEAAIQQIDEELEGGAGMEHFTGLVVVTTPSEEALEYATDRVRQAASNVGMELRQLDFRHGPALIAALGDRARGARGQPGMSAGINAGPTPVKRRPAPSGKPLALRLPFHRGTTDQVSSIYPFQVDDGLGVRGICMGLNTLSGSGWYFDPFALYADRVITNPNMIVLGEVGSGKSSFVKTLMARNVGLLGQRVAVPGGHRWVGRQVFAVDPKQEYRALAEALGIPILRLYPGGINRINPLAAGREGAETRHGAADPAHPAHGRAVVLDQGSPAERDGERRARVGARDADRA